MNGRDDVGKKHVGIERIGPKIHIGFGILDAAVVQNGLRGTRDIVKTALDETIFQLVHLISI